MLGLDLSRAAAQTGPISFDPTAPGIGLIPLAAGLLRPDFSVWIDALPLLLQTVAVAIAAALLSGLAASLLLFCLNRPFGSRGLALITRAMLVALGAVPWLAVAALMVLALGPGYRAGLIAIAVSGVPALTLRVSAALNAADHAMAHALASAGALGLQRLRFALWPQIGADLGQAVWECLNRALSRAVLAGLVGAGGLGAPLFDAIRAGELESASALLLLIVLVALTLNLAAMLIRGRR
ncbi:MAG: hypothetical protein AAGC92_01375 [Pseudomonadota bacterium]